MTGVTPASMLAPPKIIIEPCELLFVYGILKRGFELDLEREGAKFIGEGVLKNANIYRIGDGVGLLLEDEGKVYGEIFKIPNRLWKWLDAIEGHPHTYMRQLVEPILWDEHDASSTYVKAWVYVHQLSHYLGELIESGKYERSNANI